MDSDRALLPLAVQGEAAQSRAAHSPPPGWLRALAAEGGRDSSEDGGGKRASWSVPAIPPPCCHHPYNDPRPTFRIPSHSLSLFLRLSALNLPDLTTRALYTLLRPFLTAIVKESIPFFSLTCFDAVSLISDHLASSNGHANPSQPVPRHLKQALNSTIASSTIRTPSISFLFSLVRDR